MDWKIFAIEKLKQYEDKRQSLESIPLQIAEIESTMTSIRSGSNITPVSGGKNTGREDVLVKCIDQKEILNRELESVKIWLKIVDGALSILTQPERLCLERFFYPPGEIRSRALV